MAVAHDVSTEGATFTTTSPNNTSHAAAASGVRGVLVFIVAPAEATDTITAVTYGGVAMTRVPTHGRALDTVDEPGSVWCYHLGSGIPQGTQTVSVVHTGTATEKKAYAITVTAATGGTVIAASGMVQENTNNPSVSLDSGSDVAIRYAGCYCGLGALGNIDPAAGFTQTQDHDFGAYLFTLIRQTTPSSGAVATGFVSAIDDVAMIAVALEEAAGFLMQEDAIAGTDAQTKVATKAWADAIAGADAATPSLGRLLSIGDSLAGADANARLSTRSLALAESLGITDDNSAAGVDLRPRVMHEPEVLGASVDVADGPPFLFGPSREDPGDVPLEIEWSSQNPGGWADGSVVLARPPWVSAADAPLMAGFQITNQGGEQRYRGRVKSTPQVDANTIRIEAEGLAAALDDNEYWRFLGVHNDLTAWGEPSVERQLTYVNAAIMPQLNASVEPDDVGLPALSVRLDGSWPYEDGFAGAVCEAWLDTGGLAIGQIRYQWESSSDINMEDTAWEWFLALNAGYDAVDSLVGTGNLRNVLPPSGTLTGYSATKFGRIRLLYYAPADWTVGPSTLWWRVLSAFGTHGLTPYSLPDGPTITDDRYGLLDRDVIEYAVADGAPSIPMSQAFIDSGDFVVPHVVHTGTVRELIEQISVYGSAGGRLNDWGVYEAFFWRAPGWGETWRVRRDEVEFSEGGPTTEGRCTGMVITYTDGAGRGHSVGPPGSGADYETSDLDASSPLNPVEKTRVREAGITNQQGAVNIGIVALEEANAENRRGRVSITDTVEDSAGNRRPVSVVRACDDVVVVDEQGGLPPETQPIVGTSHSELGTSVSCELGLPAPSVETLLARLEAGRSGG